MILDSIATGIFFPSAFGLESKELRESNNERNGENS
jgi:hypothetical protein